MHGGVKITPKELKLSQRGLSYKFFFIDDIIIDVAFAKKLMEGASTVNYDMYL